MREYIYIWILKTHLNSMITMTFDALTTANTMEAHIAIEKANQIFSVQKYRAILHNCHVLCRGWFSWLLKCDTHAHKHKRRPDIKRWLNAYCLYESIMHCMHLSVMLLCRLQPIDCVCIIPSLYIVVVVAFFNSCIRIFP